MCCRAARLCAVCIVVGIVEACSYQQSALSVMFFCVICFMLIHVSVLPLLSFGLHFLVFCFFYEVELQFLLFLCLSLNYVCCCDICICR